MTEPQPTPSSLPSEPVRFEGNQPLPADEEASPALPQNLWHSIAQAMQWKALNILGMGTSNPYKEPPVNDAYTTESAIDGADAMRPKDPQYTDKRNLASLAAMLFVTEQALRDEFANKTILEVGSGAGKLASDLSKAGARVTELDFSQKALDSSSGLYKLLANGTDIPRGDAAFEASISVFSTSLYTTTINDRLLSYAEIFRVTRPGGRSFVLPVFSGLMMRSQVWYEGHQPGQLMTKEKELVMQQEAAMDYATAKFIEHLIIAGYINFTPVLAQQEKDGKVYDIVSGIFDINQTLSAKDAEPVILEIASIFK